MALEIFKLVGSIFVDTDKANESIHKTDKEAEGLGNKLQQGIKTAGKWAAGITAGAAAVGGAMLKSAKDTAAHADEIDKMSQKLGLSRKAYQEWDYVLSQAGVDISSMETGMKTLTNKLDDAKKGSASAAAMFEQLGLSMEDLQSMSREDIFEATIAGFQSMEDSTERAALANDLFGKSGQNLTALFNESAESTQALIDKANKLGMVMSDDAITAGVDMTDAMDTAKRSLQSIGNSIGAQLMPIFVKLLEWVNDHMPQIQAVIGKVVDFVVLAVQKISEMEIPGRVGSAVEMIKKSIELIKPLVEALEPVVKGVFDYMVNIWKTVLKPLLTGIIDFLSGVFTGNWKKVFEGLAKIVSSVFEALVGILKMPINAIIELLNKAIDGFNNIQIPDWVPIVGGKGLNIPKIPMLAQGGDITSGGAVLVGEKGPEILDLPQGARVTPLPNGTAAVGIDYDKLTKSIINALAEMLPQLQTVHQIVPDPEGIFEVVRVQAEQEALLGRAGLIH